MYMVIIYWILTYYVNNKKKLRCEILLLSGPRWKWGRNINLTTSTARNPDNWHQECYQENGVNPLINRDEMLFLFASSGILHTKLSLWCFKSNLTEGSDNYFQTTKKKVIFLIAVLWFALFLLQDTDSIIIWNIIHDSTFSLFCEK